MAQARLVKVLNELCQSGVLAAEWTHGPFYKLTLSGAVYDDLINERGPRTCDESGRTMLNGCVIVRGGG